MDGHRTIRCVCILCALVFSICAAQSANAATTAFTCKDLKEAAGDFSDPHCKQASAGGSFKHIEIPPNTTTELTVTNENESGEKVPAKLKTTINGIVLELIATDAQAAGSVENQPGAYARSTTTYSGITVAKPSGKGCKIYTDTGAKEKGEEGVIHTNELITTTEGQGDAGTLYAAENENITTFILDGCKGSEAFEQLNMTYTINGAVRCVPSGATVNCSHSTMTAEGTLFLNHVIKAAVEVTTTLKSKDPDIEGDTYKPLSATT
jgi:hypothetical protein